MIVLRRGRNFAIKSRYFVTFAIEPLSTLKPKRVGIIIEKFEGFYFLTANGKGFNHALAGGGRKLVNFLARTLSV